MAEVSQPDFNQIYVEREMDEEESTTARSHLLHSTSSFMGNEGVHVRSGYQSSLARTVHIQRKPLPSSASTAMGLFDTQSSKELDSQGSKRDRMPNVRRGLIRIWRWEIGACVLFLAALSAMAGILRSYQGKTLPHWPWRISINSVISILSTMFKGAVLVAVTESLAQWKWIWVSKPRRLTDLNTFEDAARGPFGSLTFLCTKYVQHSPAAIGAIITILALALDPFVQQVIRYYTCTINDLPGSATLPRTSRYGIGSQGRYDTPIGLITAFSTGVFDPQSDVVSFSCPTGNCSFFENFSTVAYCGNCDDVTDDLRLDVTNISWSGGVYWSGHDGQGGNDSRVVAYLYNTTLFKSDGDILLTLYDVEYAVPYRDEEFKLSLPYNFSVFSVAQPDPTVTEFLFVLADGGPSLNITDETLDNVALQPVWGGTPGFGAMSCSLGPCIRTYNSASIRNNALSEMLEDTPFFLKDSFDSFSALNLPCLSDQQRETLVKGGCNISTNAEWIDYPCNFFPDYFNETEAMLGALGTDTGGCMYQLGDRLAADCGAFLSDFLPGSVDTGNLAAASMAVLQLYNGGDITAASLEQNIQNIATVVTNFIRQNGDVNFSQPVLGVAQHSETCIHISWWWLAYPVTVAILTLIFFAITIFSTREAADWKSSVLPLISGQLWEEHGCYDDRGRAVSAESMEKMAQTVTIQLDKSTKGWKFEKAD